IFIQTVEVRVHMDCTGCESKVKDTLLKLKGVDDIDIDMATQKVTVIGRADQKKVLKIVRKTGRRAEIWQMSYNPEHFHHSKNYGRDQHQYYCNGPMNLYAPQPAVSSYNYYKHGYEGNAHASYYHNPTSHNSTLFGYQTSTAFSDDNPNACSIMHCSILS
ncbi:heavy metal-associated isoprenylated plant protein 28, partial [Carya illinoinensis]|uniref:heavy metal-associated isoprenylated plant protein 28 n=1 Tax=Carya illinoinensis TaxID=32201 RepID=UPI001C719BA4